ncbi:MAG: hypothetical protein FVQ80_16145 [Planctomycetes bacterium]|nr:hypothetical protein [Planctomycetota bacterium]
MIPLKATLKYIVVPTCALITTVFLVASMVSAFDSHEHFIEELKEETAEIIALKDLQIVVVQLTMPANDFLIVGNQEDEMKNFEELSGKVELLLAKLKSLKFDYAEEEKYYIVIKKNYQILHDISMEILSSPELRGHPDGGALMEELDHIANEMIFNCSKILLAIEKEIAWINKSALKSQKDLLRTGISSGLIIITLLFVVLIQHVKMSLRLSFNKVIRVGPDKKEAGMDLPIAEAKIQSENRELAESV